jgi:hypothetical protein
MSYYQFKVFVAEDIEVDNGVLGLNREVYLNHTSAGRQDHSIILVEDQLD